MTLKIFSLFCLLLLFSNYDSEANSIQNEIQLKTKVPQTIEEIDFVNNHAFSLKGSYPDSLFIFASKALQASKKINYQEGIAQSLTNFGVYHYQKSNHGQAIDYYLQAKEIYKKEKLFNKSASTSNNIGLIYFREQDFEKALEYHQEAIDLSDENESISNIANYKLNKAIALNRVESFSAALPIYYEAIRDLEKTEEHAYISNAYLNLGNQFGANGQLDSVKKYFDKGLLAAEKTTDFEALSYAYTSQIKYYVVTENPFLALEFGEKSLSNALTSGSIFNISDSYHTVAALQEDTGDLKSALSNLKKHYSYKDSLRQKEQTLEIARIEAKKELENEKAIFDLELENIEKSNQQKRLIIGQLIFLILTVIVLFVFVSKNLKKSKEKNQILSSKNKEIEKLAKNLKELNDHQNQIFSVIGHDLRGPVNSLISTTELITEKQLDVDELSEIMPHLSTEIKRVGVTLENLLHWALSQKEGESIQPNKFSLKQLFNEILASLQYAIDFKQLDFKLDVEENLELFADKQMIEISLRNLISNAIKFTKKGGAISCSASKDKGKIIISIEDNGIGMDSETLQRLNEQTLISKIGTNNEKGTGLGLSLCKGYVEKNKGFLEIESEAGIGTKITLTFENQG
ncbi:signal transduction histidine kinase [Belliella baltica DSM 15883]|uniref:histidine kinase n=1 Tax=Belliella baltica (strain DSM 15883 / CIP 108006 / LMG 21964 / BA134) TaxID=866536 RepID=I3Z812_BELBD|nr:tetratricopeptide repeat-containing sensor histidine kinase [Belliella baltica]AFL85380.1 signal transduction histidine kinase [Belliella baltica DSM 15883]